MLGILEDKNNPEYYYFPEDWIVSTIKAINPNREEFKVEGLLKIELNGKEYLLKELIKINPKSVFGEKYINKFGIIMQYLIKFLDSAIKLQVQYYQFS